MAQTTPTNRNFLSPKGFKFVIPRAPIFSRNTQQISVPSLSIGVDEIPNPFTKMPLPGDHMDYGELNVSFIVDEDMLSYLEIHDWMQELTTPNVLSEAIRIYNTAPGEGTGPVSDATLSILTSHSNANLELDFKCLFPVSLSELVFTSEETDITYLKCTCTMRYINFALTKI